MPAMPHAAVLTGDLIASTHADPTVTEHAVADLASAAADIAKWTDADTRFTRFRGDGWQIVLTAQTVLALRAAVYMIARSEGAQGRASHPGRAGRGRGRPLRHARSVGCQGCGIHHVGARTGRDEAQGASRPFRGHATRSPWVHRPAGAPAGPLDARTGRSGQPRPCPEGGAPEGHRAATWDFRSSRQRQTAGANADALHRALTSWEEDFKWGTSESERHG